MLVCSVSLRPPRSAIAVSVSEITTAVDAAATGNIVFATLIDDPASVADHVDSFLGEIMLEAASAADSPSAASTYGAAIVENITVTDQLLAELVRASMAEAATATDTVSALGIYAPSMSETASATDLTDGAFPSNLAIDGTAAGQFSTTNTGTVTLSTTQTNDVIVLMFFAENFTHLGVDATISTVTSPNLTWAKRHSYNVQDPSIGPNTPKDIEIWWAHAIAALSSEVITITTTSAIDDAAYQAFGVSGSPSPSSPWDANASLSSAHGDQNFAAPPTSVGITISTDTGNNMVIGAWGCWQPQDLTNPSGTTAVRAAEHNAGGNKFAYMQSFYKINPSALSGVTYTTSLPSGSSSSYIVIMDALKG